MRKIHQIRFYSVAVITSGSDFSYIPPGIQPEYNPSPGDPGSIPGKTYKHPVYQDIVFSLLIE